MFGKGCDYFCKVGLRFIILLATFGRKAIKKGWRKANLFFIAVLLLFLQLEMLHIDRFHLRGSSLDRRLLEVLAGAKLTDSTGLLELSLESLQSLFDVVAFLDWNYDHDVFTTSFFFCGCKGK
jgi:hypothetical protein